MKAGMKSLLLQLSAVEASLLDTEHRALNLRQLVMPMIQPNKQHLLPAELDKLWGHAAEAATAAATTAIAEQQEVMQHLNDRLNQLLPWQTPAEEDGYSYV